LDEGAGYVGVTVVVEGRPVHCRHWAREPLSVIDAEAILWMVPPALMGTRSQASVGDPSPCRRT
jgi:hypothetical protein